MNDSPQQVTMKMREMILQKHPQERLRLGCSMHDFSKQLIMNSISRENPNPLPGFLRCELFRKFYGNDFDAVRQKKIIEYLSRNPPKSVASP